MASPFDLPNADAGPGEPVGEIRVECHAGSRYAERPTALYWPAGPQGSRAQRLEIVTVLQRWRSPAGPGFHVATEDGRTFTLLYDESGDRWLGSL